MMKVTPEILAKAKKLSEENYETWGQWVVECMTDEELQAELEEFETFQAWLDIRITVGLIYEERQSEY
jgi:hypothetical protein